MTPGFPRFALWLLNIRLTPQWRDFVVGDLEEEFRARATAAPAAARRWLWWQILRCLLTPPRPSAFAKATADTSLLATQVPRAGEASVDARVLLFVLAVSILTGILAGALPALRAGRTDLNDDLKEGGRSESGGAGLRTRRALIVAEVALSLVLLMGAGVMLRSLHALRNVDAGFNPRGVLKMDINLPDTRYPQRTQKTVFYDTLLERVRALPGVQSAAVIDTLPVTGGGSVQPLVVEGRPELRPSEQPTVAVRFAGAGYATTMEIPMMRGRDFAPGDVQALLASASAAKLLSIP